MKSDQVAKAQLRKKAKKLLKANLQFRKEKSDVITQKLVQIVFHNTLLDTKISNSLSQSCTSNHVQKSNILLYKPLFSEVDISPLTEKITTSLEIFYPRFHQKRWKIANENHENELFADLEAAGFDENDLAIVPGLLFTKKGDRIGRGGGTYDKFLKNCPCVKIGVCFDYQIVDTLPTEEHDVKMDLVVTNA